MLPLILIDATPLLASSGFRGIGRYVRDLLQGLAATRSEWQGSIRIAAIEDLGLRGRFVVNEDLGAAAAAAFAQRGTRRAGLSYARRALLGPKAAHAGASLLHLTEALGTPVACPVPRLVTCHDLIALRFPEQYLWGRAAAAVRRRREHRRYARAEHVVAISQGTADDVVRLAGVSPARARVIRHGVDLETFRGETRAGAGDAFLDSLGLRGKKFVFYAGGADWRKNVEGMLGALAAARRSVDVDLVWAGALRRDAALRVQREAGAAGVGGNVHLLGFVDDRALIGLFKSAVAHLFLSRLEGFGLSVVEAMAAGCPVIVARGSGSDELAGEAGIVVDADDRESAGRAVVSLCREPEERARRGALGQARARIFDRTRMAREYAALYAELCPA